MTGEVWTKPAYDALAEMYDALGAIARELGPAIDALRQALDVGATPAELAVMLDEVRRHIGRAYDIAGAERERWHR